MIDTEQILWIHKSLIKEFGGTDGLRDQTLLDSSINRPYATFDGLELYPNPIDKAAALFESLIMNHPFVDGNKRIAYVTMRLLLLNSGFDIHASMEDKYDFVIAASKGEIRYEQIHDWLSAHIDKNSKSEEP